MSKYILLMSVLILVGSCTTLMDRHSTTEQKKSVDENQGMDHKSQFFVARKGVENGYVFIFHVMPAPESEGYSQSNYHLMVSIEKNRLPLTNLKLFSEVKHPDGSRQTKATMMQMGDWYMAAYNLSHEKGRHWITVTFELSGQTYSSGVYYPERKYNPK